MTLIILFLFIKYALGINEGNDDEGFFLQHSFTKTPAQLNAKKIEFLKAWHNRYSQHAICIGLKGIIFKNYSIFIINYYFLGGEIKFLKEAMIFSFPKYLGSNKDNGEDFRNLIINHEEQCTKNFTDQVVNNDTIKSIDDVLKMDITEKCTKHHETTIDGIRTHIIAHCLLSFFLIL